MSSDESMRRADPKFTFPGLGSHFSMRCGKCGQPMRNFGRRKVRHLGASVWVGKCCQKAEVQS